MRRFDREPLPSAVDTLIGTRQPVAHTATVTVGSNSLVLRSRDGRDVSGHTDADLITKIFAVSGMEWRPDGSPFFEHWAV